ncbi:flagellar basal body rod protein FlgC [Gemmatimonas sp.]|jgi:flagellar basal-body rod protein FlgC|uniref:flagellar basal body rod C-terminal domain-containing protein n=1 Tax=Gemmatimonas sp. TaxID=1962908 RepID=UPI0022C2DAEC|nr:flagellar basal body rod protein FlgC [Gemmatimonas sp.]MCA2989667.1 flagellar basal body rod protein FlgC [Gemmatimonas sp.]MCZ8011533.1 flagellar basal body rod protein FlgC [Gemmatimonas sp.]MCZ8267856.1 flagellar basal body rod protein FlgC [Gemmatimonas sp.]
MPINPIRQPALLPVPGQQVVRPMFKSMGIAASGIAAQRQRMEVIAQNIANADVTRGPDGQPYRRRDVVLEAATSQTAVYNPGTPAAQAMGSSVASNGVFGSPAFDVPVTADGPKPIEVPVLSAAGGVNGPLGGEYGVRVAGIAEDQGQGRLVYEPGHPDANEAGYVRYPDIDTTQELVKLMDAKRIYEANAAVFSTAKSMLRAALDI